MNFIPNKKSLLANVGDDLHCLTAGTLLDYRRYVYDTSTGIQTHGSYPAGTLEVTGEMRRADDGTCLYYAYFYDVMGNVVKTVSSDIRGGTGNHGDGLVLHGTAADGETHTLR